MELPFGLDYAWLARDAEGCVARFTNAGEGPIPVVILVNREVSYNAELLTRALPFVGGLEMHVSLPDPTDFEQIARRGFYGFDWQDATRTAKQSGCYEMVSRPLRPLRVEELTAELQLLAGLVRFDGLRFADSNSICVGKLVECLE